MGNESGKLADESPFPTSVIGRRLKAIVGVEDPHKKCATQGNLRKTSGGDTAKILEALASLILFGKLGDDTLKKIAAEMYEKPVHAGDILIQQGDTGISASQLYVVKSGSFEVLERRKGVMFKVNTKEAGQVFGEIAMMYNCPRNATVAATTDGMVWVLDREVFRKSVQDAADQATLQVEVFINSVPLLSKLSKQQKVQLVDAFTEEVYKPGDVVFTEGDMGSKFYIIKEGEVVVVSGDKEVNRLFKADFFGEAALLKDEPRKATVKAVKELTVLSLDRETFVSVLGPYEELMANEKSSETVQSRMAKLHASEHGLRPKAEVMMKKMVASHHGQVEVKVIHAQGHLDEVQELRRAAAPRATASEAEGDDKKLVLIENELLGEGAFSRVVRVAVESSGRQFAMKRIHKSSVVQCPEHVYYEQHITRNMAHPFCLRQYASFQDPYHLYFLFDLMPGGDLMDVLVAEANVIKYAFEKKSLFSSKVKMWKGMDESLAKFYIGSITLALEYIHNHNLVFRDLKPENVLVDSQGFAKLGDFGFAKHVEPGSKTYTFCGTPGYVAPENIMGRGYNQSVDWWTLGVLLYVLLTARQPFTSPRAQDPMEVMRRIVDERWPIKYPPYMSDAAKDLISRLLERKPVKRIGMLQGRAKDIKRHPWFKGFDWTALASRAMNPPRLPRPEDSQKRKAELTHAQKSEPPPTATPEELKEFEAVFKDF